MDFTVDGGTMRTPGFLRCTVTAKINGKEYTKSATAGFDPLTIQPTVQDPADFTEFWNKAKTDLAKYSNGYKSNLTPRAMYRKSKCLSCKPCKTFVWDQGCTEYYVCQKRKVNILHCLPYLVPVCDLITVI